MQNSSNNQGIIVGCDHLMEWLLPWWWKYYSVHNSYPVAFVNFGGMSKKSIAWCKQRGSLIFLTSPKFSLSSPPEMWNHRYGKWAWHIFRSAWFKKPFALLQSPFSRTIWLDLDCQVMGSLEPLFHSLTLADIGLAKDIDQSEGVLYNGGVIAFRQKAKILQTWVEAIHEFQDQFPSDQEILSKMISIHRPSFIELSPLYNWHDRHWGPNPNAIIHHFSGGPAKIEILETYPHDLSLNERFFVTQSINNLLKSLTYQQTFRR